MVVLAQLDQIAVRFPEYVGELQEFFRTSGFEAEPENVLEGLRTRLTSDANFSQDVASLLRVVLYREREGVSSADLLGILVAAAAGTNVDLEGEAQQAAMRDLLKFVQQARRSMQGPPEAVVPAPDEAALPPMPENAAPVPRRTSRIERSVPLETGREPESYRLRPLDADTGPGAPWWRTYAVGGVGIFGVVVGLCVGLTIGQGNPEADRNMAKIVPALPCVQTTGADPLALPENHGEAVRTPRVVKPSPATPYEPSGATRQPEAAGRSGGAGGAGRGRQILSAPGSAANGRSSAVAPSPGTLPPAYGSAGLANPGAGGSSGAVAKPVVIEPSAAPVVRSSRTLRQGVVRPGSAGIMAANVIYSPAPAYPAAASAAGVQGEVTVRAVVDTDGNITDARVVSGPPILRDAALAAVQRWRYRPYVQNGKPIAVGTTAIVDFEIPQ